MTIIAKFVIKPQERNSRSQDFYLATHIQPHTVAFRDFTVQRDSCKPVLHLEENQILLHFHQLSVSDRSFCRAGQEIRLLNYSFSQGSCHFVLLSYRCSIKVSLFNHLSFPWLNTFIQKVLFTASSFVSFLSLSFLPPSSFAAYILV